ncbi:MAG TPA: NfeD family protein [Caldimonas sp.]|jgi:membrane protein implicated in regulation of membrane protease activity
MDLSNASVWWIAAGVAVAAELATGTFYLLMIALGLAAGALAAQFGSAEGMQFVAAAIVGGGATAFWHWRRVSRAGPALPTARDRDVNLDIGERVHVSAWADDGTARVSYRGSTWAARLQPGAPPVAGEHVVAAVEGNWLVLAPRVATH